MFLVAAFIVNSNANEQDERSRRYDDFASRAQWGVANVTGGPPPTTYRSTPPTDRSTVYVLGFIGLMLGCTGFVCLAVRSDIKPSQGSQ